ncbi:MAG: efflux RND transporter periplasmic adaptor subunit [Candidatus Gracilibacteria bacterium]|nr:efflux RND transporter periplasmic adaptor subunit [Candidatus Gracilibacteria bacterium]
MSLVNEVKRNISKNRIKQILIIVLLFGIGYGTYGYFYSDKENIEIKEKKTYAVSIGNLKNSIESDGKVTLKDEFNLDFANPGIIDTILKNEGDEIKKGEIIASLDSEYLDLAIDKAKIALQIAEANYNLKKRGGTADDINISQKQLESSQASYDSTLSQTDMDIRIAEDNYKISGENLDNAKKQAEINVINSENNLDTAKLDLSTAENNLKSITIQEDEKYMNSENKLLMEAGQLITIIEKNLFDIDSLLGITDGNKSLNDIYEVYLGAKKPSVKLEAENSYREAKTEFDRFYSEWKIFRQNTDLAKLEEYSLRLKNIASLTNKSLNYSLETLKNSISSSVFSQSSLDSIQLNFENALLNLKNETSSFASTIQTTQELKTSKDLKINSAKDLISSLTQKLKISESALQKTILENQVSINVSTQKLDQSKMALDNSKIKKDTSLIKEKSQIEISKSMLDGKKGADMLELEPLYMAIISAKKNLEEAEKKKEDSFLRSPIDGKIAKISGKAGETTINLKESFATIINDKTFFVESQVAEEDIIKVKKGQKVYITFDAIEGLSVSGEVIYTSEKADIDLNGVVSYKTQIVFSSDDKRIREGMTATGEFITKEVKNVLVIPVQSVKTINGKPSVLLENGQYKTVMTGFTDSKMVEVISGLSRGDNILY